MRTCEAKPWRDYFQSHALERDAAEEIIGATGAPYYYRYRRLFNKLTLLGVLILAGAFVGLANRAGWVFSITLLFFALYLYLQTRKIAECLTIERKVTGRAVELEEISFDYEVRNASPFAISDLVLIDLFPGNTKHRKVVWVREPLNPCSLFRGQFKMLCDSGMGVYGVGPISAVLTDPLGIFEFTVSETRLEQVEVFPRGEAIPLIQLAGSSESINFGVYDAPARGNSVNFIGVRDYSRGDSLRHVAWRLSAKRSKLLVKEFEKNVNTDVSVLLDMDPADHAGRDAASTWEYAKDVALSLMSQQLSEGNNVALMSNKLHLPLGRGREHANWVTLSVFDLLPEVRPHGANLVDQCLTKIPKGSSVIYIKSILNREFRPALDALLRLQVEGIHAVCVLIDGSGFIRGRVHGTSQAYIEGTVIGSRKILKDALSQLNRAGIPAFVIDAGTSIGQSLVTPRTS